MRNPIRCTYLIGALFVALVFTACRRRPDYLHQALQLAGENRAELEPVLTHYAQHPADSMKLRAAIFLIENMPGHYSYKDSIIPAAYYREVADSVSRSYDAGTNKAIVERITGRYRNRWSGSVVSDLHIMTAAYLIDNIERAFAVWQDPLGWSTHLTFDEFCEYILPYKGAELQPLDNWREYAAEMFKGDLDTLTTCDLYRNSAYYAAQRITRQLIDINAQELPRGGVKSIPIYSIRTLAAMPFGSCDDLCTLALAVMRSKGIPVMNDHLPQWPFQAQSHSWSVVLSNMGQNLVFSAGSSNPDEPHKTDDRMAKVFRQTYAINHDIVTLNKVEADVPTTFKNWFQQDVSADYFRTSDPVLAVPKQLKGKHQYAYLAVFNNDEWVPVQYGRIEGGKVRFADMGRDCMYLPVLYGKQGIEPFGDPFRISLQGHTHILNADTVHKQTMTIRRKYFMPDRCYMVGHRLEGGRFQAANRADFSDTVTVYTIPDFTMQSAEITLDSITTPYRYWRYYSAPEKHNNIAEVYFYETINTKPIYGKVIGTPDSYWHHLWNEKDVAFDNDPLTYYDALTPSDSWTGMDFGRPVRIRAIAYTPRGDGNDVTPGDVHELLYWGDKGWVSLGKQIPNSITLTYTGAPTNALFWIRNLSRGNDERIFKYKDDQQKWW